MLGAEGLPLLVVRHAGGVGARDRDAAGEGRCVVSGPVLTRYQAVTIACALCPDGNIHEQADTVLRIANEGAAARPALTEAAARTMVERAWNETGGGVAEMHDAFTALLLRVAGPVTAEQASMAAAFDAAKAPSVTIPCDRCRERPSAIGGWCAECDADDFGDRPALEAAKAAKAAKDAAAEPAKDSRADVLDFASSWRREPLPADYAVHGGKVGRP